MPQPRVATPDEAMGLEPKGGSRSGSPAAAILNAYGYGGVRTRPGETSADAREVSMVKAERAVDLVEQLIEQVTLRKLDYVRQLLTAAGLPHTGTRPLLRDRLRRGVAEQRIQIRALRSLLDELDSWGDQRLLLRRLPPPLLAECRSAVGVARRAKAAAMEHLLGGEVAPQPPADLTPMSISFEERGGAK